jgi:hypothetical protein
MNFVAKRKKRLNPEENTSVFTVTSPLIKIVSQRRTNKSRPV